MIGSPRSGDSGPSTWMRSNATSTAWVHRNKGFTKTKDQIRAARPPIPSIEDTNENQIDQRIRRRSGQSSALLYRSARLREESRFQPGAFRWLTVASPEQPDGTELQLALNNNPAAKAYQAALFQQNQPAAMFFTDDLQADYERMKALGAEFTMPPTDVTASKIAMLNDTCGNLIQITQLMHWQG